jgi:hypothetical protein
MDGHSEAFRSWRAHLDLVADFLDENMGRIWLVAIVVGVPLALSFNQWVR